MGATNRVSLSICSKVSAVSRVISTSCAELIPSKLSVSGDTFTIAFHQQRINGTSLLIRAVATYKVRFNTSATIDDKKAAVELVTEAGLKDSIDQFADAWIQLDWADREALSTGAGDVKPKITRHYRDFLRTNGASLKRIRSDDRANESCKWVVTHKVEGVASKSGPDGFTELREGRAKGQPVLQWKG